MSKNKTCFPEACCTLGISGKKQERFVKMARALGNPIRFEILKFLVTHPGCINVNLVKFLPIAQATVSQHLKVLLEAGWITGEISGRAINYCLDAENIRWFKSTAGEIF